MPDTARIVRHVNSLRRRHRNTPDVTWSDTVARFSQSYAETLAARHPRECELSQADHSDHEDYGENLSCTTMHRPFEDQVILAVDRWYKEIADWNFGPSTCDPGKKCGHFTALVWDDTTQIGAGVARNARGHEYIVMNFLPKGNWRGQYHLHVHPLRGGGPPVRRLIASHPVAAVGIAVAAGCLLGAIVGRGDPAGR